MGGGYVLDFTDRTFSEFFEEHTRRDIDTATYRDRGTPKANRLRGFWATEGNHLVGKVIQALIQYGHAENCLADEPELANLIEDCWKISARMLNDTPVAELDALTATADERDFETVAQHVREAIEKNQPEAALDRLHTFVMKYLRTVCANRGVEINRDKALHSIFGEYVKRLRDAWCQARQRRLDREPTNSSQARRCRNGPYHPRPLCPELTALRTCREGQSRSGVGQP